MFFLAGFQPGVPIPYPETYLAESAKNEARLSGRRGAPQLNLRGLGATGVIGALYDPRIAESVLASGLPVVAMDLTDEQLAEGSPFSRLSEIRPDSHKAGRLAAEHLLERGFRNFGFCGYPTENWSRRRQEGFFQRLQEAGFDCDIFQPHRKKPRLPWPQEQPELTAWLRPLAKPLGVMACNDRRGHHLIEACSLGGMHVPNDVAVVGVDEDHLLSELSSPPLSSVALDAVKGGYQAAELLDGMMSGETKKQQLMLVDALWVVSRLSTDVMAVEDRDVAAALRYIRDNGRRPIGVGDVVKYSAVSRRVLEMRFQRSVGRSIREEIERVRVGWVKELLIETDLPMSKIANNTGFTRQNYLSAVFRRATAQRWPSIAAITIFPDPSPVVQRCTGQACAKLDRLCANLDSISPFLST